LEKAPDAFRTISEVADDLDIPQHVLRFWESRFSQIKPMKRGGGRRYYRPEDVALLRGIRHLLYGQGYTIKGVQRILREQGIRFVQSVWEEGAEQPLATDEEDFDTETAAEGVEGAETGTAPSRRLLDRLRAAEQAPEPRRAATPDARREPRFSAGEGGPAPHQGGLTSAERQTLRSALAELSECRRVLEAALDDA
jgi:DNA-binding transcriptional MerR regulator